MNKLYVFYMTYYISMYCTRYSICLKAKMQIIHFLNNLIKQNQKCVSKESWLPEMCGFTFREQPQQLHHLVTCLHEVPPLSSIVSLSLSINLNLWKKNKSLLHIFLLSFQDPHLLVLSFKFHTWISQTTKVPTQKCMLSPNADDFPNHVFYVLRVCWSLPALPFGKENCILWSHSVDIGMCSTGCLHPFHGLVY